MQSDQHVKRLIRELDLPEQAEQVIQRPKYWTPAFCRLYLEKCDRIIFDDAHAGLQAAEVAPELVSLVNKFNRDPRPRAPLLVRALAVLGSAYRAVGDLEQSEETYQAALRLVAKGGVPKTDQANLLLRVGVLRSAQNRLEEASDLAEESVKVYRQSSAEIRRNHLGEALTIRGYFHQLRGDQSSAAQDWSEALTCTDPRTKSEIHYAASHNLARSLVERAIDPRSLSVVEGYVGRARKFLSKHPRSIQKLRMVWLQGAIMMRFGSTRRGEAAFKSARRGFIEMKAPFDLAMVSLELGKYLHQSGQFSELCSIAIETHELFKTLSSDQPTAEALKVWKEAVLAKTVSTGAFARAWKIVHQRAAMKHAGAIAKCS